MLTSDAQPQALPSTVNGDDAIPRDLARHELRHASDSGHDVKAHGERFQFLERSGASDADFLALTAELETLGNANYSASEPSELDAIRALLPAPHTEPVSEEVARAGTHAAWTGRIVGNMLGKPIEDGTHWTYEKINAYLASVDAVPLVDYIPVSSSDALEWGFLPNWTESTRGRVDGSSRDDDIDYTILNLHILEQHGAAFTPADIAAAWLERLPYRQTFTAERAAYRNIVRGVPPTLAGGTENPYREWIGALIRADVFGMVCPGDPRRAAELAWKDAVVSHRGNGIYAEMWAASLVAGAFAIDDVSELVHESLRHIPPHSRLANEVRAVLAAFTRGESWDTTLVALHARHSEKNWVHSINNAGVITAALLWGDGDFSRSIELAVRGAFDTDSNAATVGAVAGVLAGPQGIDERWTMPLHDLVRSAIFGYDRVSISDLAERTNVVRTRIEERAV